MLNVYVSIIKLLWNKEEHCEKVSQEQNFKKEKWMRTLFSKCKVIQIKLNLFSTNVQILYPLKT